MIEDIINYVELYEAALTMSLGLSYKLGSSSLSGGGVPVTYEDLQDSGAVLLEDSGGVQLQVQT